jgi:hypothetical protein
VIRSAKTGYGRKSEGARRGKGIAVGSDPVRDARTGSADKFLGGFRPADRQPQAAGKGRAYPLAHSSDVSE